MENSKFYYYGRTYESSWYICFFFSCLKFRKTLPSSSKNTIQSVFLYNGHWELKMAPIFLLQIVLRKEKKIHKKKRENFPTKVLPVVYFFFFSWWEILLPKREKCINNAAIKFFFWKRACGVPRNFLNANLDGKLKNFFFSSDMETIDALIRALNAWRGGLLIVSHDQHFLQSVAKEYWIVAKKKIIRFTNFHDAKAFALEHHQVDL